MESFLESVKRFENPLAKLSFENRAWVSLAGGFLIHLVLGSFYLWSTLNVYVGSYLRNDGQNYTQSQVNAVFPFMMLAINVCNPFGVTLANKIGFRNVAILCSFLLGGSIFISSFYVNDFALFSTFYGFIFGFASGLVYMIPFNTSYLYFPDRKGFVSGVISGGFGFGATLFLWTVYGLMNPHDEKPFHGTFSKNVSDHLPGTLMVLGVLYFIISFIGALLIERPTASELESMNRNEEINSHELIERTLIPSSSIELPSECQSVRDGIETKEIYQTIGMAALFCCFGIMMIANFKPYAQLYDYSDSFLTVVATVGSIVNGISRMYWGYLMEKITIQQIITYNLLIQIFISSTLRFIVSIKPLFFIYIILAYFSYGGWFAKLPALVARIFGKKIGTTIYGVTFIGFTIAGWIQFFLVRGLQQLLGWENMFVIFTIIQVTSLLYYRQVDFKIDWKTFYAAKSSHHNNSN